MPRSSIYPAEASRPGSPSPSTRRCASAHRGTATMASNMALIQPDTAKMKYMAGMNGMT